MKKMLIPVFSLAICLGVFLKWTDGFSAFTIFSYTLNEAGDTPRKYDDFQMMDQDGVLFNLKEKQKYVLINFVYLDCPFVCHKVNNQIDQIYHLFDKTFVPEKLEFVTVSFDPGRDSLNKIRNYRNRIGTDITGWTFALPYDINPADFTKTLRNIGVWTYQIPESGMINHSVYLFLVSPDNEIVKVFDPARLNDYTIAEEIKRCLDRERT